MTVEDLGEVILEATRNGAFLKVTAVHVATGVEATAVGPAAEPKAVERLAVAKLRRLVAAS
ncbi:DUF6898 family protein [Brevundimonas sp.]|uniref:DUF6898 family protein n=1 Tax=Brevundimonas sp. TaxID=1871086 RepID=UPI00391B4654|nr:hypothetical protein [Brevundimonas sp.]MCA3717814.1 hypothetical protein [Brevundimonas sp.]